MKKRNCKRRNRGDSLGETLVALLIIALGMTMLAGPILSSARLNKKAKPPRRVDPTIAERTGDGDMGGHARHGNVVRICAKRYDR